MTASYQPHSHLTSPQTLQWSRWLPGLFLYYEPLGELPWKRRVREARSQPAGRMLEGWLVYRPSRVRPARVININQVAVILFDRFLQPRNIEDGRVRGKGFV